MAKYKISRAYNPQYKDFDRSPFYEADEDLKIRFWTEDSWIEVSIGQINTMCKLHFRGLSATVYYDNLPKRILKRLRYFLFKR